MVTCMRKVVRILSISILLSIPSFANAWTWIDLAWYAEEVGLPYQYTSAAASFNYAFVSYECLNGDFLRFRTEDFTPSEAYQGCKRDSLNGQIHGFEHCFFWYITTKDHLPMPATPPSNCS
jgi:hypothetical protein